jgi:hypothetical protein
VETEKIRKAGNDMDILKLLIPLLSSFVGKLLDNSKTRKALTRCNDDLSECQRQMRFVICAVLLLAGLVLIASRFYTIAPRA